ncbi:Hypothetical predicted protein [Olea europaea subsp. europaea]|uniref:Uncharacterized protein n=1 Tax=Olea europaea subsp. europaea TaxID=158383 RepID=A0A8S0SAK2_OLEEU|nr:Hypothetical predicted protein [Olea europaea subsp. europaea]
MAFGDLAVVGMGKLGCNSGGGNLAVAMEVILTPSLEMWEGKSSGKDARGKEEYTAFFYFLVPKNS